ncbi:unnamed protein product [Prunus armeniaca]|uniref:Myb/SANT-like domain-containing protein n=1 Tax=Prunus armeniaca TaxID=36596 RepID=A0A6J5W6V2_PRUAR|nr:unnamed protein product [Prunus armeniaca]
MWRRKQETRKGYWDDEAFDAFIKICVVETIDGNRSCGHFSKKGWKNVENPEASKFRTCGLKDADQLDILFRDIDVTSDGAWATSQGSVHDVENVLPRQTENSNEDGDYSLENGLEYNDGLDNIDDIDTSPNIETFQQDKARKEKGMVRNLQLGRSIEEVMQVVEGIHEIVEDDEVFVKAAYVLTERKNREMFVAMRQTNRQIMWLRSAYDLKEVGDILVVEAPHHFRSWVHL